LVAPPHKDRDSTIEPSMSVSGPLRLEGGAGDSIAGHGYAMEYATLVLAGSVYRGKLGLRLWSVFIFSHV